MIRQTKVNLPTKLRKPPTYLMSPEDHRGRAEIIRQAGGLEEMAVQHEMLASAIERAIQQGRAQMA